MMDITETGEIVMAATAVDLHIYLTKKQPIGEYSSGWKTIEDVGRELEDQIFASLNIVPGTYIYADIGASKINYANKKNAEMFWSMALNSLKDKGFENLVGRISNPIPRKIFCKYFGA